MALLPACRIASAASAPSSRALTAIYTFWHTGKLDSTSNPRYEYDPWLLDDHPLRTHPTECIPGLGTFLAEWLVSTQKRWKETLIRATCLILACLATFQCLRALPPTKALSRPAMVSRLSHRNLQNICTFPHSDPRPNALAQSVAAGCEGFRTDIWMHNNELQMGVSGHDPLNDLHVQFGSLPRRPESNAPSPDSQIPMIPETSSMAADHPFMLILDAKSPLDNLCPVLELRLDTLRRLGRLTHWDGAELIPGAVTVVVTGELMPSTDCVNHPYSDLFWIAKGDISSDDFMNGHLTPICV
ncbi:uncharacterized protein N7477_008794 [Penicillium maclennaniae]|uniref:uncharacterized protein n=1 Tax=Penicillium maclennaniae TaxID=1343394 RepID=UPI0025416FB2|nr:uncharacterized protein N7477_008794 [Penicillium maclennaniae]KAJ5666346.1 hypothetical protein N7477_008794 [Penicillium maclennaniae]